MEKSRQHFVPQFYLRAFASAPNRIHLYSFGLGRQIPDVSLRKQCSKHRFYGKTNVLEDALSVFEGIASQVLQRIIVTSTLPSNDTSELSTLLFFVVLQLVRTPLMAETVNDFNDKAMKPILKHDPQSKDFDLDSVKIGFTDPPSVSMSMAGGMFWAISDLRLHLVCAAENQYFLTSDAPVVRYNQYYENALDNGVLGMDCRGLQIFFPISPKQLLMLYDPSVYSVGDGRTNITSVISAADVEALNLFQAVGAEHNLYYSDRNISNQVLRLAQISSKLRLTERTSAEEFPEVGNEERSSLIVVREQHSNLRLALSFVRIHKRARKRSFKDRMQPSYRYRKTLPGTTTRPLDPYRKKLRMFGVGKND